MNTTTIYHRPPWMKIDVYRQLHEKYLDKDAKVFNCNDCGRKLDANTLHWDHISPRSFFEKMLDDDPRKSLCDIADNIQPLCGNCNCRKGVRPDSYWGRRFFFDENLDLSKLRTSQRDYIYDLVSNSYDWVFSRNGHSLSSIIMAFIQATGSGKTIGMMTTGFAYNQARRQALGENCARCSKMLLVTKEQQLRDQMASELRVEPYHHAVVHKQPNVLCIDSREVMERSDLIDECDIAVLCTNMLWERNTFDTAELEGFLRNFDIMVLSEMHHALEQAGRLTKLFTHGPTFGDTATPIDKDGRPCGSERVAACSVFGLQDATSRDDSMKGLGRGSATGSRELRSDVDLAAAIGGPGFERSEVAEARNELAGYYNDIIHLVDATPDAVQGVGDGVSEPVNDLPRAKSVADEAIAQMLELDLKIDQEGGLKSEHRTRQNYEVTQGYYTHAIIRCKNQSIAAALGDYVNNKLNSDRSRFPKEKGWCAEVKTTDSDGGVLDADHPWMRYHYVYGMKTIDSRCARILIVVGMACEGTNNPPCLFECLTYRRNTLNKLIQGIGRPLRSTGKKKIDRGKETLCIPPSEFDNIRIVAHISDYGVTGYDWQLPWCLHYLSHLSEYVSRQFRTLDDCFEGDSIEWSSSSGDQMAQIDYFDKVALIEAVGQKALAKNGSGFGAKEAHSVAKKFCGFQSQALWCEFSKLNLRDKQSVARFQADNGITQSATEKGRLILIAADACNGKQDAKNAVRKQLGLRRQIAGKSFVLTERIDYSGHSDEVVESAVKSQFPNILEDLKTAGVDPSNVPAFLRSMYKQNRHQQSITTYACDHDMHEIYAEKLQEAEAGMKGIVGKENFGEIAVLLSQAFDMVLGVANSIDGEYPAVVRREMKSNPTIRQQVLGFVVEMLSDDGKNGSVLDGIHYCAHGQASRVEAAA